MQKKASNRSEALMHRVDDVSHWTSMFWDEPVDALRDYFEKPSRIPVSVTITRPRKSSEDRDAN